MAFPAQLGTYALPMIPRQASGNEALGLAYILIYVLADVVGSITDTSTPVPYVFMIHMFPNN